MAVAKDATMAMMTKMPNTEPTAAGCANVFPFVTDAEKQPISDCVELAKIRSMAWPSKSGIARAIGGMPATSDGETGMIPPNSKGELEFVGHKLRRVSIRRDW